MTFCNYTHSYARPRLNLQKQPSRGVFKKTCCENIQQIDRKTPLRKCDFNKVAMELYWNHTSGRVFSCKFAAYFQNTFSEEYLWTVAFEMTAAFELKIFMFYAGNVVWFILSYVFWVFIYKFLYFIYMQKQPFRSAL